MTKPSPHAMGSEQRQALTDELVGLSNDFVGPEPTSAPTSIQLIWASVHPVNKMILIVIAFVWAFILYNQYRSSRSPPIDSYDASDANGIQDEVDGDTTGENQFSTPEQVAEFKEEQTFDGLDTNKTMTFDPKDGVLVSDTRQSTLACYLLGINCPAGQPGRGVGANYEKDDRLFHTYFNRIPGSRKYSMNLADAMAQGGCKNLSRDDAETFFCERGATWNEAFGTIMNSDICKFEVDSPNCGVWKQCMINIASTHFSDEAMFLDTRFRLNESGTKRVQIPGLKNKC